MTLGTKLFIQLFGIWLLDLWPFKLSNDQRRTHSYLIGTSGSGKSALLQSMIVQDIQAGRGLTLLDNHGDLAIGTIRLMMNHFDSNDPIWEDKLIYWQPSNPDYSIGFNILDSGDSGLDPFTTASLIVQAMKRAFPESLSNAPRFSDTMTFAVMTLMESKSSLSGLYPLLTDKSIRTEMLKKVSNPRVKDFWNNRFDKGWGSQKILMIESILNKLSGILLNAHLNRIFCTKNSSQINFRQIMDEGKILIIDMGGCLPEARSLLGNIVISYMEQVARMRPLGQRRNHYLYLDEFGDLCGLDGGNKTIETILAESRKFNLFLTLAHQHSKQLSPKFLGAAISNAATKIVMRVSYEDSNIAHELFELDPFRIKHQVTDTEQAQKNHPVYFSSGEQWEQFRSQLTHLRTQEAYVKTAGMNSAVKIKTPNLRYHHSEQVCNQMIDHLIASSGVHNSVIDQELQSGQQAQAEQKLHIKK